MLIFFLVFSFVFGLVMGSFANCMAWRLYQGEGLWSRSHCPKCLKRIAWFDNIPLLSFLLLKMKCRHCRQGIAWQYPLAELVVGLLFAFVFYYHFGSMTDLTIAQTISSFNIISLSCLRDWLVISFLAIIFIMDFKWYVVADEISLLAIAVIFLINLSLGLAWPELAGAFIWWKLLLAMALGAGVFALQHLLSGGAWVGSGDIRLGALMGATLGWTAVLTGLVLAYFIGAVFAIILVITGRKKLNFRNLLKAPAEPTQEMILPFGPFLAIGTVVAMFYGEALVTWYQTLFFIF
jgi:prepilin signal peptidase PulO-like enzyme (type II secretory pathway)